MQDKKAVFGFLLLGDLPAKYELLIDNFKICITPNECLSAEARRAKAESE